MVAARSAAWLSMLSSSAPVIPVVLAASSSRLTSSAWLGLGLGLGSGSELGLGLGSGSGSGLGLGSWSGLRSGLGLG